MERPPDGSPTQIGKRPTEVVGSVASDHRPRRTGIEAIEREGGGNVTHVVSRKAKPYYAKGDVDPIGLASRLH